MKKVLQPLLIAAAMLCTVFVQAQSTVTIGTGTSTARQPFGTFWGFERSAAIYHTANIGRSGVIEKLSWYTGINNSGTNIGVRIYLKHVTANNFPSTSNWATVTAGAKLVYSDSSFSISSGQWKEFTLTDTFNYYNTENLMVLVEMNTGGGGNGSGTATGTARYTSTTGTFTNTHQYWTADNTPPAGNGTANSNRPNLIINFVPDPIPDLVIDQVLSPSLAGCNVNTYDLQFRVKNIGGAAVNSGSYLRYGYTLNSGSEIIDSFQLSSNLATNGTVDHSVNVSSLTGIANLNFKLWSNIDADVIKTNDSATKTVINPVCINANSTEDFENGDGGWTSNSLWAHGTIAKGSLTNPPSGTQGFITNLSGFYPPNANASLVSPYLDFSTSCSPIFTWSMRFQTENNWDGMIVEASSDGVNWNKITTLTPSYNNNSNSGPMPAPKFSGNNTTWTNYTADLSAYSGMTGVQVRFRFASDGSGQDNGIAIDDAKFELYPLYTGSFNAPDTMFVNSMYDLEIENTSPVQIGVNYRWLLDGVIIASTRDLDYAFPNTGTHTLKLRCIDPCNAVLDSVVKTVIIINPSSKPNADFVSDVNTLPQFGTAIMTNLSDNGPTSYEWYTTPSIYIDPVTLQQLPAVSYDNGTSAFSKNPEMSFIATGKFEICLIAENGIGRDTLCKVDYIEVGGGGSGPIVYGTDSLVCVGAGVDAALKSRGTIFDPGGPNGNYPISRNCDFIIDFKCFDSLVFNLDMIDLETGYDYIRIYDGPDASGTPLWDIANNPDGLSGTVAQAIASAKSGTATIQFESDGSITYSGFALSYEAMNYQTSITADFDIPDTICATYLYTFNNTTIGGRTFEWDFFGNGSNNSTQKNPSFTYSNGGFYNVRLIAEGCAGIDTIIKTIFVSNPGQNIVAFSSPHTTYTTNDVVRLLNETNGCVEDFEWVITPNRVNYLNNSRFNPMADVMFDTAGVYSVKLYTTNAAGTDSLIKTNYITINDICSPKVDNNIADMGISRVVFGSIDNSSAADLGFTDYGDKTSNMMKGEVYEIKLYRQSTSNEVSRKVWLDYNADGDFDDAGELIVNEAPSRTPLFTDMIRIPRSAVDGIVTMRVSYSYGTQANNPCGTRAYGEIEDYRLVLYTDAVKPVITKIGLDTVYVNRLDSYTDLGATAMDNLDGNITSFIQVSSTLDSSIAGTYYVNYEVTDTAGNVGTAVRTIIVLPDAPSMTLNGPANDTIEVYSSYANDLLADAFDFNSNTISVNADYSNLDTSIVGNYTVTYTATDMNGRSSSVTRNIAVVDRTAPTATLIGSDTITIEVYDNYTEQGLNITDNYCVAGNFFTPSVIDWNTIGIKVLNYTVEDCFGNTSSASRVIRIVDTKKPEIHLTGALSANVIRLRDYVDSGYTVSDNYNTINDITIDTLTNLVNSYNVGLYTLQYRATDVSGNFALSEIRFIYVIDNVGIDQVKTLKLEVYPNPNKGQFSVSMDEFSGENVIIRVSDMKGHLVHNENVNNFSGNAALNLENAAPGMYLVHVIQGSQQAVAKIVINK